jgi:hypothetical protein
MKRLVLALLLVAVVSPAFAHKAKFDFVPNPGVFNFQDYWNVNTY